MTSLRFKPGLALAAAMALGLAGCGNGPAGQGAVGQQTTTQPQTQAPDAVEELGQPVTLALLVPRSSSRAAAAQLGDALAQAARMGVSDLNDSRIELRIYDTAGDPAVAASAAARAVADGADIILGPLFGSATKTVAPTAASAGLNVLSFSTDTSVAGGNVWVTGFLPEMEAARILSFARSQSYLDVGVFYPQTPYGDAALRGALEADRAGQTAVVGSTAFTPGFQGIQDAAEVFASSAAGATAILIATGGTDLNSAGSFMNFYEFDPVVVKYLGLGQWFTARTLKEVSLRGGWFPAPDPDASRAFSDRFAARYGSKPPLLAVLGYDAVQIAGQSVAQARRSGEEPFSAAALTQPAGFSGAFGPVRLTPDGRNERALAILEVRTRGFETIDPAPESLGAGF
ncbi:MAG: penicillin-binding protein activator [Pseudomonadota bacterium]